MKKSKEARLAAVVFLGHFVSIPHSCRTAHLSHGYIAQLEVTLLMLCCWTSLQPCLLPFLWLPAFLVELLPLAPASSPSSISLLPSS